MGEHVTSWWCEHAWLPDGVANGVRLDVEGDRILSVISETQPTPTAIQLTGLVLPGLAHAHSHAFHRALRSRTQAGAGDFWSWREQMYAVSARLDPDSYLKLAHAVYVEMALAGITTVGEFHYLHHAPGGVPYSDPNAMGVALLEAAKLAGIRLTLLDTCYLTGGFGVPLSEQQLRFSDGDAERWSVRATALRAHAGPEVTIGAAIHSVRAVPAEQLPTVAQWAAVSDAVLHMHLSEQPGENEACRATHGCTPTALLADAGALTEHSTVVHATHLTGDDVAILARNAVGVCLCPTTERDLADGIGPSAALSSRGIPLSLGSDSHAVIDIFEEARAVELDERLATLRRGNLDVATLARAATNHAGLGFPDAGEIAPGRLADFIAIDTASVRTAGGGPTLETLVFAAAAADVTDVVVAGRVVVRDRQHVGVADPGRALEAAISGLVNP
jgi:formiminoglutamate deiminase